MIRKMVLIDGERFWMESCYRCKVWHAVPETLYRTAQQRPGKVEVFCPNGHGYVYQKGESVEEILRRENDRLKQQLAQKDDQIIEALDERDKVKHDLTAVKKKMTRVANGVCPDCNRSFANLGRHMETKHKKRGVHCFEAIEVADAI